MHTNVINTRFSPSPIFLLSCLSPSQSQWKKIGVIWFRLCMSSKESIALLHVHLCGSSRSRISRWRNWNETIYDRLHLENFPAFFFFFSRQWNISFSIWISYVSSFFSFSTENERSVNWMFQGHNKTKRVSTYSTSSFLSLSLPLLTRALQLLMSVERCHVVVR